VLLCAFAACGPSTPPPQQPPPSAPHHDHHGQHGFHDAERWAGEFDAPDRDTWQQPAQVIALMLLQNHDVVADLGAGTGYFVAALSRAVPDGKVIALDTEPAMVDYLTKRFARDKLANASARIVKPDDPGLTEASVHKILVVNTWHHISDRVTYARKLYAALAACSTSPALLAIVDFTAESPIGPPPAGRIPPEAVVTELETAGFQATIADETLPHQYVIIALRVPPARCSVE
jgi:predicted methyltransferase